MADTGRHEEWAALAALVDTLLDAAPAARPALVDALSAGDPARRATLVALLAECEHEPTLLRVPATERFAALLDDDGPGYPEALVARYAPTAELGRGGMATVYLARDVKHGRDVAVKVVRPVAGAGVGRFLAEIEIAARLHHPHVVPLFDSGEADGAAYYVMPYHAEQSLRQRLARDGPLAPAEAALVLRDVCDALAHAHAHGVVHRDVKPDNVLLAGRHAMVADFGVAQAAADAGWRAADATGDAGGGAGGVLGTPAYMAPEQIAGDPHADHRVDLYAVGVLGYELLAGRPPFDGATRAEVLAAHRSEEPVPLAARRPDVPAPLAALVMRSLAKRPDDRWQSADAMLRALEPLVSSSGGAVTAPPRRRRLAVAAALVALVAGAGIAALAWRDAPRPAAAWRERWSRARIERVTDFPGAEVDAAISADGRTVAFLSDRDGVFDVLVSRVGSGRFANLTLGRLPQLFNEDVRNVGFTHDASHVWMRVADLSSPASVSLVPTAGGAPRPFLPTAVSVAWRADGARLAYHEVTPGDPIFVADGDGRRARRLHVASPGLHSHHPAWSPDGRFLYYVHGLPPNEMDVWRLPIAGGPPERMTTHHSRVGHPVPLDAHTLLYTATDDDGAGPWLYLMDVDRRVATRLSTGVEHFVSIAASADVPGQPRRLVATVSNPTVRLWSVPLGAGVAGEAAARPVPLPTARSAAPRFAPDGSLLYVASRGGADGVWRDAASGAREVWRPGGGVVADAVASSPDGRVLCAPVRRRGRSTLRCTDAAGGAERTLAAGLDVRGAPSWSPDGRWIAIAARDGAAVRVFKVPAAGGAPVRLVDSVSSNPVWSPDGRFIVYSGTARGRGVPLRAVTPDGTPHPLPFDSLRVDRLGDSYRFLPDGTGLVAKLGGFRRQDFWLLDVATGARRRLTQLRPGESVHRFDVSPDGTRILFERVNENSDVALIELPVR